jgi:hypothetical protein
MGAAAPRASSVFLAYAGTDGAVYLRNEVNGSVTGLGGRLIGGPAVAQTAAGLAVFGRGTDNALWYEPSILPIGNAGGWTSLGGRLASGPAAATAPGGKTYVFVLGTGNLPWMRSGIWPSLGAWTSA